MCEGKGGRWSSCSFAIGPAAPLLLTSNPDTALLILLLEEPPAPSPPLAPPPYFCCHDMKALKGAELCSHVLKYICLIMLHVWLVQTGGIKEQKKNSIHIDSRSWGVNFNWNKAVCCWLDWRWVTSTEWFCTHKSSIFINVSLWNGTAVGFQFIPSSSSSCYFLLFSLFRSVMEMSCTCCTTKEKSFSTVSDCRSVFASKCFAWTGKNNNITVFLQRKTWKWYIFYVYFQCEISSTKFWSFALR